MVQTESFEEKQQSSMHASQKISEPTGTEAIDVPEKLIYTTWMKKDGRELNVHFLNVADHRPLGPDELTKRRKINFPLVDRPITLLLRGIDVAEATFYSPDTLDPVPCKVTRAGPDARLTIPAGKMKMYGLARIQLNTKGNAQ